MTTSKKDRDASARNAAAEAARRARLDEEFAASLVRLRAWLDERDAPETALEAPQGDRNPPNDHSATPQPSEGSQ